MREPGTRSCPRSASEHTHDLEHGTEDDRKDEQQHEDDGNDAFRAPRPTSAAGERAEPLDLALDRVLAMVERRDADLGTCLLAPGRCPVPALIVGHGVRVPARDSLAP